jgi:Tol biopolymer transport system component
MKTSLCILVGVVLLFSCDRKDIDPDKYVLVPLIQTSRFPDEIQINYYMPLWAFNRSKYVYGPTAVSAERYDLFLSKGDTLHFEFLSQLESDDQIYSYPENTEGTDYFFKIRASAKGVNPSFSNLAWVQGGINPEIESYDISVDNSFALCSVSPDGTMLLYERNTDEPCCDNVDLMTYSFSTGTESKVVDDARQGSWSSDGKSLVFASSFNITTTPKPTNMGIIDLETSEISQISEGQNTIQHPIYSADGKTIFYLNVDQSNSNPWEIREYETEKNTSRVLVAAGESRISNGPISLNSQHNLLAYNSLDDLGISGLYAYDLTNKNTVQIEQSVWNEYNPSFSNNGKYVAFISSRSGKGEIWVKDLEGGKYFQLTGDDQSFIQGKLVWTADDKKILYKGYDQETDGVYSVDFDP